MEEKDIVVVLEFKSEIFDPKKEALLEIAAEVAKITADPSKMTKEDLELINTTKNKLVKARTSIAKAGKAARAAATQYNRDVKAYEDELIAILEPEELRLKKLETDAKDWATKEARRETLPEYKEKLLSINGTMPKITDDELLEMDPTQFQEFYLNCKEEHLDNVQREKEEQEKKDAEAKRIEEERIAKEKADLEAGQEQLKKDKYNARAQRLLSLGFRDEGNDFVYDAKVSYSKVGLMESTTDEFFEKWANDAGTYIASDKRKKEEEAEARKQQEIQEAEARAKEEAEAEAKRIADEKEAKRLADEAAEQARLKEEEEQQAKEKAEREAEQEFQTWLTDNSYNAATDTLIEDVDEEGGLTILYRTVSIYRQK